MIERFEGYLAWGVYTAATKDAWRAVRHLSPQDRPRHCQSMIAFVFILHIQVHSPPEGQKKVKEIGYHSAVTRKRSDNATVPLK